MFKCDHGHGKLCDGTFVMMAGRGNFTLGAKHGVGAVFRKSAFWHGKVMQAGSFMMFHA